MCRALFTLCSLRTSPSRHIDTDIVRYKCRHCQI